MKIKIKFDGQPFLIFTYEKNEWERLEKLLRVTLKLEIANTKRLFGLDMVGQFYKETNQELKSYLDNMLCDPESSYYGSTSRKIDDINMPIFNEKFNIALFRVVPVDNTLKVPLYKFLNVLELNEMVRSMQSTLSKLFSIVLDEEVTIKLNV